MKVLRNVFLLMLPLALLAQAHAQDVRTELSRAEYLTSQVVTKAKALFERATQLSRPGYRDSEALQDIKAFKLAVIDLDTELDRLLGSQSGTLSLAESLYLKARAKGARARDSFVQASFSSDYQLTQKVRAIGDLGDELEQIYQRLKFRD